MRDTFFLFMLIYATLIGVVLGFCVGYGVAVEGWIDPDGLRLGEVE